MTAQADPDFKAHKIPVNLEYIAVQRPYDQAILDTYVSNLAERFGINTANMMNIADITEKLAEPEFGTASTVVRYAAAIECINQALRRTVGIEIDSIRTIAGFYERHDEEVSRSFSDLLAYVEQRIYNNPGLIRRLVERAAHNTLCNAAIYNAELMAGKNVPNLGISACNQHYKAPTDSCPN
ncbi:hypothetical protein COV19_01100 [Candidatus Woesearchaeota archaeon CG10_big_fil_rev_8_21_14_0_10_44_13]|nr:MAG: hypothetical protein COV19_01100 [Candidatus Woesearchaeota archaeon CG10_big_fil_rev_8_21_14_0_10_44_13]